MKKPTIKACNTILSCLSALNDTKTVEKSYKRKADNLSQVQGTWKNYRDFWIFIKNNLEQDKKRLLILS